MDRPSDVLRGGVAQHGDVTGLGIDLHIADVRREARSGALGVEGNLGRDRSAGARQAGQRLQQGQRVKLASFAPAGIAQPSSQTTFGLTSQIIAARRFS